jgi:DNA-binding transcriptional regulator YhcF (GntR family)
MPESYLGPRALRVYEHLRNQIAAGAWVPGVQLPSVVQLASQFGVAPMTIRTVQDRLENEGLIIREQGRGTFVRESVSPAVLIVDDERITRNLLRAYTTEAGFRAIEAADPATGLAVLAREPGIVLVFSDVRMPDTNSGIEFIRTVRRRWPKLLMAAVTGFPDDLTELHDSAEIPALLILKPIRKPQIDDALQLIARAAGVSPRPGTYSE